MTPPPLISIACIFISSGRHTDRPTDRGWVRVEVEVEMKREDGGKREHRYITGDTHSHTPIYTYIYTGETRPPARPEGLIIQENRATQTTFSLVQSCEFHLLSHTDVL